VTDRYVRLTSDTQGKAGGLWSSAPVTYPDWEMHVNFKVHGSGKELFGDGFVIWYVRDPKLMGKYIKRIIHFIRSSPRSCFWLSRLFSWISHYYGYLF
jgi:hypothetical protein